MRSPIQHPIYNNYVIIRPEPMFAQLMYLATPPTNMSTNDVMQPPNEYALFKNSWDSYTMPLVEKLWVESVDTSI